MGELLAVIWLLSFVAIFVVVRSIVRIASALTRIADVMTQAPRRDVGSGSA